MNEANSEPLGEGASITCCLEMRQEAAVLGCEDDMLVGGARTSCWSGVARTSCLLVMGARIGGAPPRTNASRWLTRNC